MNGKVSILNSTVPKVAAVRVLPFIFIDHFAKYEIGIES